MSGSPTQDLSRLRIDRGDAEMLRITRTVLLIAATSIIAGAQSRPNILFIFTDHFGIKR